LVIYALETIPSFLICVLLMAFKYFTLIKVFPANDMNL